MKSLIDSIKCLNNCKNSISTQHLFPLDFHAMPTSPKPFSSYSRSRRFANLRRFIPLFCFLFGLAGFLFGSISFLSATPRPRKCAGSDPLSVSVSWELSSQLPGDVALGAKERHKVMGFVGIQTGFKSAGRRKALRSTWFPSDHQGLLRFYRYSICFEFVSVILKKL
jgi:hypothetical protein